MASATCIKFDEFAKSGLFSYQIEGHDAAVLDASGVIAALDGAAWAQQALYFALKTAARNATAGLMDKEPAEAAKRVSARLKAWSEGKWQAASERTGEPRESLLARAVAEALGLEVADAAEQISAAIAAAQEEGGVDPESEDKEVKAKANKIARDIRDQLRDDSAVLPIYTRMQKEELDKRAAAKGGEGSKPSVLASIIKR